MLVMKTTKDDFELFKKEARKWQSKLGLTNWALYFKQKDVKDCYARTHWHVGSMAATLEFCTKWDDYRPKNAHEIDKLALHEVLHVLMAPLISEAEYRYTTNDAIETAEHSIVRSLENMLD